MSEAFTTSAILLVTLLLFTHYMQKGFGGMSTPLRQFGMFLLTKAAGPASDLFQERKVAVQRLGCKLEFSGWF